jgi:hypothetical protein
MMRNVSFDGVLNRPAATEMTRLITHMSQRTPERILNKVIFKRLVQA